MSQAIQPPPFVDPPPFVPAVEPPVIQPAVRLSQAIQSPRRSLPWLPILTGFVAGWLVAQVPVPQVASDAIGVVASLKYTPEQRAVLDWAKDNLGNPDIEIIRFEQSENDDGTTAVTLKYRGDGIFGEPKHVWTRKFVIENGIARQIKPW